MYSHYKLAGQDRESCSFLTKQYLSKDRDEDFSGQLSFLYGRLLVIAFPEDFKRETGLLRRVKGLEISREVSSSYEPSLTRFDVLGASI